MTVLKSAAQKTVNRLPRRKVRDASDDELVDCDGRDPDAIVERAFDHGRELGDRVSDWLSLGDW